MPTNKEKHFLIVDVEYDDDANVVTCVIEAAMTKRQCNIQWRELNDTSLWLMGWN